MPDLPTRESVFGTRQVPQSRRSVQGYEAGGAERAGIQAANRLSSEVAAQEQAGIRAGQVTMQAGERWARASAEIDALQEKRNADLAKLSLAKMQSYALQQTTELGLKVKQGPYTDAVKTWDEGSKTIMEEVAKLAPQDPVQRELAIYGVRDLIIKGRYDAKLYEYDGYGAASLADSDNEVVALTKTMADKAALGDKAGVMAVKEFMWNQYKPNIAANLMTPAQAKAKVDAAVVTAMSGRPASEILGWLTPEPKQAPLNVRNNNPGNMRGKDGEFVKYDNKEDGMKAMREDLAVKISGKSDAMKSRFGDDYKPTLSNVITTWAPPEENDTDAYIASVSQDTGIAPDQVLTKADIKKIMPAMIKVEGGENASKAYATTGPLDDLPLEDMAKLRKSAVDGLQSEDPVALLSDISAGKYDKSLTRDELTTATTNAQTAIKKINEQAEFNRGMKFLEGNAQAMAAYTSGEMDFTELNNLVELGDISPDFAEEMKRSLVAPEVMDKNPNLMAGPEFYSRLGSLSISDKGGERVAADFLDEAARLQIDVLKSRDLAPKEKQTIMQSIQLKMVKTLKAGDGGIIPDDHYGEALKKFMASTPNIAEVNKMFREYVAQVDAQGLDAEVDGGGAFDPKHWFYNTDGENERDKKTGGIVKGILARQAGEKYEGLALLPDTPNAAIGKDGSHTVISNGKTAGKADAAIKIPEPKDIPTFKTEAEAEASGKKGVVIINGRRAKID